MHYDDVIIIVVVIVVVVVELLFRTITVAICFSDTQGGFKNL